MQYVRWLAGLIHGDAERLAVFKEAVALLLAAPPTAYPANEAQWLVSTIWNRGATLAKFAQPNEAMVWMALALKASAVVEGFEKGPYQASLASTTIFLFQAQESLRFCLCIFTLSIILLHNVCICHH
jgi:hypothetical protein